MDAHNLDQVAPVVARTSSRRALLKRSLALGVVATAASGRFGGTVLGQTTGSSSTTLGEHVVAEWDVVMPQTPAFGFGSVWVPSHRDPNVTTRIDAATNKIIAVIEGTGWRAHQALVVGDRVWVTGENDDMAPIDPTTNTVGTPVPGAHTNAAFGFDSIWATNLTDGIDRIDPATSKIVASIALGDGYADNNNDVLVTAAAVWVDHADEGELIKIDPVTNTILSKTSYEQLTDEAEAQTTVPVGKGPDFLWRETTRGLLRIDPDTVAGLTFLPLGAPTPWGNLLKVDDDAVWLSGVGQVTRIDVASNQIGEIYQMHEGGSEVALGFGSVWVVNYPWGLVQRLDLAP